MSYTSGNLTALPTLPTFDRLERRSSTRKGQGRSFRERLNRPFSHEPSPPMRLVSQPERPAVPPSQASDSPSLRSSQSPRSSSVPGFIRNVIYGPDASPSPYSRRSLDFPETVLRDNRNTPLLLELEQKTKDLDAERALTAQLRREHAGLEGEVAQLIETSNSLAKENSTFKQRLQIESEEMLISKLLELHNNIRSWCQRWSELTAGLHSAAKSPELPRRSSEVSYSFVDADRYRVPYVVTCVWEHLLDGIFQQADPKNSSVRDLWTTQSNAKAIKHLELALKNLDSRDSTQWRSLTVRLVSQAPETQDKQRDVMDRMSTHLHPACDRIAGSVTQILGSLPPHEFDVLKESLFISVLVEATAYDKVLRQQRSWAYLSMPPHTTTQMIVTHEEKELPARPSGEEDPPFFQLLGETCVYQRPALARSTSIAGEKIPAPVTIEEAEELRFHVFLDKNCGVEADATRCDSSKGVVQLGSRSLAASSSNNSVPRRRASEAHHHRKQLD